MNDSRSEGAFVVGSGSVRSDVLGADERRASKRVGTMRTFVMARYLLEYRPERRRAGHRSLARSFDPRAALWPIAGTLRGTFSGSSPPLVSMQC